LGKYADDLAAIVRVGMVGVPSVKTARRMTY